MPIGLQPGNGGGGTPTTPSTPPTQASEIQYKVQIEGQEVYPLYGFSITKTLDRSLDTSSILLPNITRAEKYPINSWVRIERWVLADQSDKEIFDFLVGDSVVEHLNSTPALYNHTIQLLEYTKLLEQDIISTRIFTQPGDVSIRTPYTLKDVVEKLIGSLKFDTESQIDLKYEIETNLAAELDGIRAPEFRFNNLTFKEALDRVFSYINGVARLVRGVGGAKDTIICDKFEALGQLISLVEEAVVEEQDLSSYANTGVIQVNNAVSNEESVAKTYYPSIDGWATMTDSDETDNILRTGDFEFKTDLPIYKILKIEAYWRNTYSVLGQNVSRTLFRDITDYVFDKEKWDNLPDKGDSSVSDAINKILSKANTVYYERGQRNIKGLSETFQYPWTFGGDFPRIKRLLITELFQAISEDIAPIYPTPETVFINRTSISSGQEIIGNTLYRITYIPFIENSNFELEKQRPTVENKIKSFVNQQDRLIDIEALGRSIQNTIDQNGQPIRKLIRKHNDIQGLYKIGDFTSDGYIVKSADYFNERNFIEGKYTLTQDFFEINKFIGIDREYRAYDIILAAQDAIRTVNHKQYVLISDTFQGFASALIFSQPRRNFMETLLPSSADATPLRNIIFLNRDVPLQDAENLVASVSGKPFGKSLIFNWQFSHPRFAGYSLRPTTGFLGLNQSIAQIPISYTDPDDEGLLDRFSIAFTGKLNFLEPQGNETRREEIFEISKNLPRYPFTYDNLGSNFFDPFVLDKDPSEILSMNYILQTYTDKENIIIGNELLDNNLLIGGEKRPLVLYSSPSETYKITDQYAKGVNRGLITNLVSSTSTASINNFTVSHFSLATSQSWAIADQATNKILLAVNREGGVLPTTIHFHFLRNRI